VSKGCADKWMMRLSTGFIGLTDVGMMNLRREMVRDDQLTSIRTGDGSVFGAERF
jgi:hypothetical protein